MFVLLRAEDPDVDTGRYYSYPIAGKMLHIVKREKRVRMIIAS